MEARRWLIRVMGVLALLFAVVDGLRRPLVTMICLPLIVGAVLTELGLLPLEGTKK